MSIRLRASWLVACALCAAPARADEAPPQVRAREFFEAGTQAFDTGQYRAALKAYEEAYALEALPETAFSMGQAARLAFFAEKDPALLEAALGHYQRYIDQVPAGRRRAHAVQHIAALEALRAVAQDAVAAPATPRRADTLLLVLSKTPGARACIAGRTPVEVPAALEVDAGEHRVVVSAPGHEQRAATSTAVAGKLVVATIDLTPLPASLSFHAPPGTVIALDERELGTAPLKDPILAPAGPHRVAIAQLGRAPEERRVELAPGERRALAFELRPPTDSRLASYGLFAASGALALGAGASLLAAWEAEGRALDFEARIGSEPLSQSDLADYGDAVESRDAARGAGLSLLGISLAAGLAGGVVLAVDATVTATPPSKITLTPTGAAWRVHF